MPRQGYNFLASRRYFARHRDQHWHVIDRNTNEIVETFACEGDAKRYAADLHNGLVRRPTKADLTKGVINDADIIGGKAS